MEPRPSGGRRWITFIASAIIAATSETFAGRIMVVLVACASSPNLLDVLLGDAELHGLEAARRPGSASATARMPSAVAAATARIADAAPSASLICCCLFASEALMTCCFSPSAVLIGGVALALGGQDDRALLALGAHLLLHRGEHVLRRA